jgi:asparagine synthase (glutamine-hydrolysing)
VSDLCAIVATGTDAQAMKSVLARIAPWRLSRRMRGQALGADSFGRATIIDSAQGIRSGTRVVLAGGNGLLKSVDQTCWMVFDGEIYNRQELCQQLGSPCSTQVTDAELVLTAYETWGADCVHRFNGAWAFLILDLRRGKLIGSRDRFGIRPLYYGEHAGALIFSGHAQAVALGRTERPDIDCDRLTQYLRGLPPRSLGPTFYRDVRTVPPASVFEVALGGPRSAVQFRKFWQLSAQAPETARQLSFADAQQEFLHLLEDSIRLRTTQPGGLGCFLSGGLDSSLISRLMVERLGFTDIPTYSLVYSDPQMTDWPKIQAVIRQGGLRSNTTTPTAETLWALAEEVIRIQGAPLLGLDLIANWQLLTQVAHTGCSVVLDGAGADEVLGATLTQQFALIWDQVREFRFAKLFRELHAIAKLESWRAALGGHLLGPCLVQWRLRRGWNRYDWLAWTEGAAYQSPSTEAPGLSAVQQAVRLQVSEQNVPTVLAHISQNAAAAGVRIRRPYLDHRLVEYCFHLRSEYRSQIGIKKRILREASKRYLPSELFTSKSRPIIDSGRWISLLRQHGDALREMAQSPLMSQLPMINAVKMRQFVHDYISAKHDDGLAVWRLYASWRWLESLRSLTTRSLGEF